MERDLGPLFFPKSVAVIGASPRRDSLAGAVLRNLISSGYAGKIGAVHPRTDWGEGIPTARSVDLLPFVPDLTVWGVPFDVMDSELPRVLDRGGHAHVVLSAGFSEAGRDGSERERRLVECVRAKQGVMVGPNCMGLQVSEPMLDASFCRGRPLPGSAALFMQSGSVGEWLLVRMAERKLGAAVVVSLGNMGDLDVVSFLEAVPHHFPNIRQIFLYLETMPEVTRLMGALSRLPSEIRVFGLHGGQSKIGARAVEGHTGALAEEPLLVAALWERLGIQRVASLTEALDVIEVLQHLPPCRGRRACVVTNAGGPGILVADALVGAGFELPEPSPTLSQTLRRTLAPAASVANPIDLLASAMPDTFRASLSIVAEAPDFDVIVPVFMHPVTVDALDIATAFTDGIGARKGDTVVCWMAGVEAQTGRDQLRAAGLAVIEVPERLGCALGLWASLPQRHTEPGSRATSRLEDRRLSPGSAWGDPEVLETALAGPLHRPPRNARYAGPLLPESLAIGILVPLYLKVESAATPHKATSGHLARVERMDELGVALSRLRERFPQDGRWLVQEAVPRGQEVYVGFLRHPRLGSFVGFGPGGAGLESGSTHWISLPTDPETMQKHVQSVATHAWLGRDTTTALESLIERMASLGEGTPRLSMAEVNPAIWDPQSGIFWIVDARWQALA